MGQHTSRFPTRTHRALLRAGLMAAAAGSALAAAGTAGAAAAQPADGGPSATLGKVDLGKINEIKLDELPTALQGAAQGLEITKRTALGSLAAMQLDPLAKTGSDPLDNSVGTALGEDGAPISTAALTGPLAEGASLSELPTAGPVVSGVLA